MSKKSKKAERKKKKRQERIRQDKHQRRTQSGEMTQRWDDKILPPENRRAFVNERWLRAHALLSGD